MKNKNMHWRLEDTSIMHGCVREERADASHRNWFLASLLELNPSIVK